jgi:hypothetical protein
MKVLETLDLTSNKIINLANGVGPNDAVNVSQLVNSAGTSVFDYLMTADDPVNPELLFDDDMTPMIHL